jgi:CspA family cold shock protein
MQFLFFRRVTPSFYSWCKVATRHPAQRAKMRENNPTTPRRIIARINKDGTRKDRSMPTGTVKWFNTTKGFGFIAPDDGGKDVFVHISAVERAGMTGLPDNMKISFALREGRDGRSSAVELQKIG